MVARSDTTGLTHEEQAAGTPTRLQEICRVVAGVHSKTSGIGDKSLYNSYLVLILMILKNDSNATLTSVITGLFQILKN
jgi:hypothetical protein